MKEGLGWGDTQGFIFTSKGFSLSFQKKLGPLRSDFSGGGGVLKLLIL